MGATHQSIVINHKQLNMSTITSHKLSLTCIRIHLKKCYVLLILLMMCSSLPMLGEEQYKWMKTLDKVTLERFQSMLSEAYHPDISNRIDSFVSVAEREKDWRKTYLAYKLKAYNLSGKGMVEEAAKSVLKMAQPTPLTSIWHRPTAYCCATTR